jgi:hypothetical protein
MALSHKDKLRRDLKTLLDGCLVPPVHVAQIVAQTMYDRAVLHGIRSHYIQTDKDGRRTDWAVGYPPKAKAAKAGR